GAARIGEQRGMEPALGGARLRRRAQFRPRQIGFEELVGDQQSAASIAIGQMMAAGEPEIVHSRSPRATFARSTISAGSSSVTTSWKENACHRFAPLRGRKLRNASRIAPS